MRNVNWYAMSHAEDVWCFLVGCVRCCPWWRRGRESRGWVEDREIERKREKSGISLRWVYIDDSEWLWWGIPFTHSRHLPLTGPSSHPSSHRLLAKNKYASLWYAPGTSEDGFAASIKAGLPLQWPMMTDHVVVLSGLRSDGGQAISKSGQLLN